MGQGGIGVDGGDGDTLLGRICRSRLGIVKETATRRTGIAKQPSTTTIVSIAKETAASWFCIVSKQATTRTGRSIAKKTASYFRGF